MLEIITADKRENWNSIVKSFNNWDIYYLNEYAVAFQLHGDGVPLLIYYHDDESRFCYVSMRSDISDSNLFADRLSRGTFYDLETPYGYGGPLSNGIITEKSQIMFLKQIKEYSIKKGIVSQFVRFHPVLENHDSAPLVFDTKYLRDTIYIDTASPDLILSNMDSKNRNMVRKAKKNSIQIIRKSIGEYGDFLVMYEETMAKNNASAYYTFNKDYFEYQKELNDYACIFYAVKDSMPIAAAIMYYNKMFMHYHLAGTHTEYRALSPNNLLLFEAACWASERGIKKFHLGGGMSQDDSLFAFKKQFNKKGRLPFVVGRTILQPDKYDYLLGIRKELNSSFDENNSRMIQYRYQ